MMHNINIRVLTAWGVAASMSLPTSLMAATPTLVEKGNNKSPSSAFPLQHCQGDCDNDGECDWGLNCFQRSGLEAVPGCSGSGISGKDYCYIPPMWELVLMGDEDLPTGAYPLSKCEGDCDNDGDCKDNLVCFQRNGIEEVPGCTGDGYSGRDYCYDPGATLTIVPLGECQGDCTSSRNCDWGLNCFERSGSESVPGCFGPGVSGANYCYVPPPGELVLVGDEDEPASNYPLQECQADCDDDSDCAWGLVCMQRSGNEPVPGCTGEGLAGEDYCITPTTYQLVLMGDEDLPAENYPLGECEGDCDGDSDCEGSLECYQRSGNEEVPGCTGWGKKRSDYCYDPTFSGSRTNPPVETLAPGTITYQPGNLNVFENGLLLSQGLTSRIIATMDQKVQYDIGGQSSEDFHTKPDGGAVFKDDTTGGWVYVSNSESSSNGGVGAITFNSMGEVVGFKSILTGTERNCGGGKTYWNTWITCEETDGGQVWEVDPFGNSPGRQTIMGGAGANYESAAYDNRNELAPTFYVTTDEVAGPLVRFTPDPQAVQTAVNSGDYSNLLHTDSANVKYEYFKVTSIDGTTGHGTYEWTESLSEGQASASQYFVQGEGIDIRDGIIYFTTKADKLLFIIDIDNMTFERTSTESGAFDSQPDQVARVLDFSTGATDGILYFCEDGGDDCGVHGRNAEGDFFTILEDGGSNFGGETSGLAFSPDGRFMYVAFQKPGYIFEIRRLDGFPFQGQKLDIKYHQVE